MFDKQIAKTLEAMLNQMSDTQKSKLAGILQNEESLKKAVAGVDPQKIRAVAKELNIAGAAEMDVEKLMEEVKKNPELARGLAKKL